MVDTVEEAHKLTKEQLDKLWAVYDTDQEEKVWEEIELDNKNKLLAWEKEHGWPDGQN